MEIPFYQVDAFTSRIFGGNPAAVCPLERWLDGDTLQRIAAENNLSETAFFVPENGGFRLRWFTPTVEVELCGHATLASSHVLYNELGYEGDRIQFETQSGTLTVNRGDGRLEMNFPSIPAEPCEPDPAVIEGLGVKPQEVHGAVSYLCVYRSADEVLALKPNFERLKDIDRFAVIVTAPGDDCDFVSRFFAPSKGIPEDPVTGAAHCTLTPYWANRLGKNELFGRQVSRRGGEVWCRDDGDRVGLAGQAVTFARGKISLKN